MNNQIKIFALIKCRYENDLRFLHYHEFYQIIYVLDGMGYIEISQKKYSLKKGDVFLVKRKEFHSIYSDLKLSTMQTFEFKFDCFHSYYGPLIEKSTHLQSDQTGVIRRIISTIEELIKEQKSYYVDMVKMRFSELLLWYLRYAEEPQATLPLKKQPYNELRDFFVFPQVLDYINYHYKEKLSLENLAAIVQMEAIYFSKQFKKTYGLSPTQYLNYIRIEKAKELLQATGMNITEIAEKTGFSSIHYFSKCFTKQERITPQKYRNDRKNRFMFLLDFYKFQSESLDGVYHV